MLGDFGLSLSALRSPTLAAAQKSNLFWLNALLGTLLALLVLAAGFPAATLLGLPQLSFVIGFLSISFLFNGLAVQFRVEVNRRGSFTTLASVDVIAQATAVVGAIVLAASGLGVISLIAQSLIYSLVVLLGSVATARWIPGRWTRSAGVGDHLKFGAFTSLAQVFNYLSVNVIPILIGATGGTAQVGFFNRASQLAVLPVQQVAAPLTRAVLPHLSSARSDDLFRDYFTRWQRTISYVLLGALSLLCVIAGPVVSLTIGDQWSPAVVYVQVLAIGSAFQAMGYAFYWGTLARGLSKLMFLVELPGRLISVALAVLFISWGPTAIAFASSLGAVVVWAFQSIYVPSRIGVSSISTFIGSFRALAVFTVSAVSGIVALWVASPNLSTFSALLTGFGCWLLTVGLTYLAIPAVRRDVRSVWSVARPPKDRN